MFSRRNPAGTKKNVEGGNELGRACHHTPVSRSRRYRTGRGFALLPAWTASEKVAQERGARKLHPSPAEAAGLSLAGHRLIQVPNGAGGWDERVERIRRPL